MTALCLRIRQASLVYVNSLMLQDVLAEPQWSRLLTPVDRCELTPLFWGHVRPYGEVRLDLGAAGCPSAAGHQPDLRGGKGTARRSCGGWSGPARDLQVFTGRDRSTALFREAAATGPPGISTLALPGALRGAGDRSPGGCLARAQWPEPGDPPGRVENNRQ